MEIHFQRDLDHNYLMVEHKGLSGKEYELKMMERNRIPGLLPVRLLQVDGKKDLCYEITAHQPVSVFYEKSSMKGRDLEQLIGGIGQTAEGIRPFLMDSSNLLLKPEYIFRKQGEEGLQFCYVPDLASLGGGGEDQVKELAEYVLKKIDHSDPRAVELGYALFSMAETGNFSIRELLERNGPAGGKKNGDGEEKKEGKGNPEAEGKGSLKSEAAEDMREESRDREKKKEGPGNRTRQKSRRKGRGRIGYLPVYLGLSLLTAGLFAAIVWLGRLDLTQTGGLAFLFLALVWLACTLRQKGAEGRTVKIRKGRRREGQDGRRNIEILEADPEEEGSSGIRSGRTGPGREDGVSGPGHPDREGAGFGRSHPAGNRVEAEDRAGDEYTRCMTRFEYGVTYRLVSEEADRYPDVILDKDYMIVGKKREYADIWLEADAVSRLHARLERTEDALWLMDLNSTNGTFVNGERLRANEKRTLKDGDRVAFANIHYELKSQPF